jgi:hypothetical protein
MSNYICLMSDYLNIISTPTQFDRDSHCFGVGRSVSRTEGLPSIITRISPIELKISLK